MFKKDITPSPKQKLKSSIQRNLRQSLLTTYPLLTPYIDDIIPKKASLDQIKLPDRVSLYVIDGTTPLFFQADTPSQQNTIVPHLKLVHRFPQCFPTIRIDRGAIRFVLSGATLMAPGLTSKGGRLPLPHERPPREKSAAEQAEESEIEVPNEGADEEGHWSRELEKGEPVVVLAEGKDEACAVGVLVAGTKEIKEKGKGPVIEEAHCLGDGLWRMALD